MSWLQISDFVKEGKYAIRNENYWAALSVALMLPSLCGRIEYKDNPKYVKINRDGSEKWNDKKTYIDWCNKHLGKVVVLKELTKEKDYSFLYKLRCDIIHAGNADISCGGKSIYFVLHDGPILQTYMSDKIYIKIIMIIIYTEHFVMKKETKFW